MTEPTGTLALALREASAVLATVGEDLRDEASVLALLESLGVALPAAPASLLAARTALASVGQAALDHQAAVDASGEGSLQAIAQLGVLSTRSGQAFGELLGLEPRLKADLAARPDVLAQVDLARLVERLVASVLVRYLRARAPVVYNALAVVGVVDPQVEADEEGEFTRPYVRQVLRWSRLRLAAEDPALLLAEVYGWGTPQFDDREILRRLHYLLMSAGLQPAVHPAGTESALSSELRLPLLAETGDDGAIELGLALGRLEPTGEDSDPGLALRPFAVGTAAAEVEVRPGLRIAVRGAFEGAGGLGIGVRPPLAVALVGGADAGGRVALEVDWRREDGSPFVLVSQPGTFVIQVGGVRAGVEAATDTSGEATLGIELGIVGGELKVSAGEDDGFLRTVLPPEGITAGFELGVAWSPEPGLRFVGSGGFDVTLPLHLSLAGILDVHSIHVAVTVGEGGATAAASATFAVTLGPIQATAERMGFAADLSAPETGGNLGPVHAATRFQPPSSIGLAIDAQAVKGGGFVFFDDARGQYGGVLQLELAGTIAVKAIGIITTRLPDGSDGFALFVLITAEGFSPIQLGLGFTLNGIGGLLGVNRSVSIEPLRGGLKTGTLDSVLFPPDPVRNAPAIISTLNTVFPLQRDHFVFGPMAIIGWGSPTLVTLKLGLLLEFPDPTRLILLGRLAVALPTPDEPIVSLKLDALGVLDFDRGELSLDASLFDSRVAAFTITGDMALRVGWGAEPQFLLSVGGFNPRLPAPPGLRPLERLAISLAESDNPRLRLEAYFAVTSNTIQFGARLELYAAALGFSLEGHLGFDAFLQLVPFGFVIDFSAAVAVRFSGQVIFSVSLEVTLSGPSPWRAVGSASFTFLLIHATVGFDLEIGEGAPQPVPELVDVRALLADALADPRNWASELPAAAPPLVSLRDSGEPGARVHPLAVLVVRERIVPLNRRIARYGSARIRGARSFALSLTDDDGEALPFTTALVRDAFARGQYEDLRDDEKLTLPAFEPMDCGLRLGLDALTFDAASVRDVPEDYETWLWDPQLEPLPRPLGDVAVDVAPSDVRPLAIAAGLRP
jgi:hypothetical protein